MYIHIYTYTSTIHYEKQGITELESSAYTFTDASIPIEIVHISNI